MCFHIYKLLGNFFIFRLLYKAFSILFRMRFSRIEIKDLLKAWFMVTLAFTILFLDSFSFEKAFFLFLVSLFTVGIGFLLHEMMHKFFATRYGCWAEFRADSRMLWLMVVMSFFGFIFAAPGGVYIRGRVDVRKNCIISLAGPMTNLVLALLFFLLSSLGLTFLHYGSRINSWLALFNMIPFYGFDGQKVLRWNKAVYTLVLLASAFFVFFSSTLL